MKLELIITIIVYVFFSVTSFVVNYKKVDYPYFVIDAIWDSLLCLIPVLNIIYPIYAFYEAYLEKYFNTKRIITFLNKRLK
jgi:hypothetical protein